ncbi:MAG TPA: GNAT family N-acetyltransferase [Solirubrobacteraceae bacterium]|nr:GNAT family N-acetyltransferase [Solirubrobacteraceae bacterium]
MLDLVIRFASPDERAALEALQLRASLIWEDYRADLLAHPEVVALTEGAIEQRRVRVATTSAGERAGFAEWSVASEHEWELEGLFVEPASMRRGIGARLLHDVFALARAAGARRVAVIAEPHAAAFYERHGFAREGDVATRFGPALRLGAALAG